MNFVCNAGPVIALAKIDHLHVLGSMAAQVHIPETVYHEVLAKPGAETDRILEARRSFMKIVASPHVVGPDIAERIRTLDAGEAAVISVAAAEGEVALLDDAAGRRVARSLGVPVMGFVGLLLAAKRKGHVAGVVPLLLEARSSGYWLSDELIGTARRLEEAEGKS